MTITEFINGLAAKAGIIEGSTGYEKLKAFMADAELAKKDIPAEISKEIEANLFTAETAKKNQDVRNAIRAEELSKIDAALGKDLAKFKLSQEDTDSINKLTSTYEKITAGLGLVAKNNAPPAKDETATITALREQIAAITKSAQDGKASQEQQIAELMGKYAQEKHNLEVEAFLRGFEENVIDAIPKDLRKGLMLESVNAYLDKKGAAIGRINNELKIVQKNEPNLEFVEGVNKLNLSDVLPKVLTEKQLYKQSAGNNPAPQLPIIPIENTPKTNAAYEKMADDAMEAFKNFN